VAIPLACGTELGARLCLVSGAAMPRMRPHDAVSLPDMREAAAMNPAPWWMYVIGCLVAVPVLLAIDWAIGR